MESEVIAKIKALARQVHQDNVKQIFKKLDSIEIDVRYLVAKVTRLESIAK